mgnify:CR=1 FL=1
MVYTCFANVYLSICINLIHIHADSIGHCACHVALKLKCQVLQLYFAVQLTMANFDVYLTKIVENTLDNIFKNNFQIGCNVFTLEFKISLKCCQTIIEK